MPIYIVIKTNVIDKDEIAEVFSVTNSFDNAMETIKKYINLCLLSYKYDRFQIQEWDANTNTLINTTVLSREDNIKMAKELNCYMG